MTDRSDNHQTDANVVDIRWLELGHITASNWRQLETYLDTEERTRAARFHFEHDRQSYIAAHALQRAMLSERIPVRPDEWRFSANPQGKPEVVTSVGQPRFRTNLSHTRGLAAVALTVDHDIGIDVEWRGREGLTLELADHFFAPAEIAALKALPAECLNDGLFAFWTLKEAFIKAVGLGLSMPLDVFAFTLEPLAIRFAPGHELPGPWLFRRFRPTEAHALALAVRHPEPSRLTIVTQPANTVMLLDRQR